MTFSWRHTILRWLILAAYFGVAVVQSSGQIRDVDSLKSVISEKRVFVPSNVDSLNALRGLVNHITRSLDSINHLRDSFSISHLTGLDSLTSRPQHWVSRVKGQTRLTGSVTSESFATNYQDPFTPSERVYSRVYGSPGIQVGQIPLRVDFYVTTEENTVYNSNSFNLYFDVSQFKQNLQQKKAQALNQVTGKKSELTSQITELKSLRTKLTSELETKTRELTGLENLIDTSGLKEDLKTKVKDYLPDTAAMKQQVVRCTTHIQDSIKGLMDSTVNQKTSSSRLAIDSFERKRKEVEAKIIQTQHQVAATRQKIEQLDSMYNRLQSLDSALNQKIALLRQDLNSPSSFLKIGQSSKHGKRLLSLADKVEVLELGINYPVFSRYSLNGLPVKGINLSTKHKKDRWHYTGGRTINSELNTFGQNQPNPSFTRNVQAVGWEHEFTSSTFGVSSAFFWDNRSIERPQLNVIQTLDYNWQITRKLNLSLGSAHSLYQENRSLSTGETQGAELDLWTRQLYQSAFHSELRARLDGKSKLKVKAERVYPGFMNLANPFMRSGYDQIDAKLDRKFFKRRLHIAGSYKHFQDNILGNNQGTNTMQGYGFTMRTALKKYPNVFIQHNPYQQGNNHPDSLFRTNTQLSVTSVGVIYTNKGKNGLINILGSATRSYIDFNKPEEVPVENRFLTLSANTQRKTLRMGLNGYRNTSLPSVDTLNYSGVRIDLEKTVKKSMKLTCSAFGDFYDSGSYRYLTTLGATYVNNKTSVTLNGSVGEVYGLFGLNQKMVLSCGIVIQKQL